MEELIKTHESEKGGFLEARELHNILENRHQFANWINQRIDQYGYII